MAPLVWMCVLLVQSSWDLVERSPQTSGTRSGCVAGGEM